VDEAADLATQIPGQFEERQGPLNIVPTEGTDVTETQVDVRLGRKVEDRVDLMGLQDLVDGQPVVDVNLVEGDRLFQAVSAGTVVDPIDDDDRVTLFCQKISRMQTDETTAPGNQDSERHLFG